MTHDGNTPGSITDRELQLIEADYRAGTVERVRKWCLDPGYRRAYVEFTCRIGNPEFALPALRLALQVLPDEPELTAALARFPAEVSER